MTEEQVVKVERHGEIDGPPVTYQQVTGCNLVTI